MQGDQHVISVVIPTLGRKTLALCKEALTKQTRPADEVIVVLDCDRRRVAWARNEGIRLAKGDLIAFTDDDCVPPTDWLERMIRALDQYDAAVAGGTFRETDPLLEEIRRRKPMPVTEQVDTMGLFGNTENILYRKEVLGRCCREDGFVFHESLRSGQDWELIWRLRKRGVKMVYVPNPVTHLRRATLREHCRHSFRRGIGIAFLYKIQHADAGNLVVQDSLLWGREGRKDKPQWGRAVWEKIIGPFGMNDFQTVRHYWLFWCGEKFQAAGFLWGLMKTWRKDGYGRSIG